MNRTPAIAGTAAFAAVSWIYAAVYVASNDWFGAGDLKFAAAWSILPSPGMYAALRVFDRRTASWKNVRAYGVAAACGLAAGLGWTFLVALLFGASLGAVSYPLLLSWLSGALAAFALCASIRRPATWPCALLATAVPVLIVGAFLDVVFAQPPDIIVELAPDATQLERDAVWDRIRPIEGTAALYSHDSEATQGIGVSFQPGTSVSRRAGIVDEVQQFPFVVRVSDMDALEPGKVRGRISGNRRD